MEQIGFTEFAIGGVALAFIVDRIIASLNNRGINLQKMSQQLDDLHKWHDVSDNEGVKLWYVRRSLEETIDKLSEVMERTHQSQDKHTRMLEKLLDKLDSQRDQNDRLLTMLTKINGDK